MKDCLWFHRAVRIFLWRTLKILSTFSMDSGFSVSNIPELQMFPPTSVPVSSATSRAILRAFLSTNNTDFVKPLSCLPKNKTFQLHAFLHFYPWTGNSNYRPQRSLGKVIFSQAFVKNSVHRGGSLCPGGSLSGGLCPRVSVWGSLSTGLCPGGSPEPQIQI